MPDEFHGDETLLTSHETLAFSLLAMSAKVMIFNVMKPYMKLPLKLPFGDITSITFSISKYKAIPSQ